jgi:DNA-binding transcriptional ArsR family regulator
MDKIFKALADRNRRLIVTLLKNNLEMNVTQLLVNFQISQSTLSNHLAILRKAKLVKCKVKGKERIYEIEYEVLGAFIRELNKFIGVKEIGTNQEIAYRGSK